MSDDGLMPLIRASAEVLMQELQVALDEEPSVGDVTQVSMTVQFMGQGMRLTLTAEEIAVSG